MINFTILQFYWNRIRKKIPLVKSLPLSAKSLSVNDLVEAEDGLGDGENCCLRPTVDFAGDLLLEVKNFVEQCFAFYLWDKAKITKVKAKQKVVTKFFT